MKMKTTYNVAPYSVSTYKLMLYEADVSAKQCASSLQVCTFYIPEIDVQYNIPPTIYCCTRVAFLRNIAYAYNCNA